MHPPPPSKDTSLDLALKLQQAHKEVVQGSFVPDRENDELIRALGNKEHPGRTRGIGLVPWVLGFIDDAATYRSRARSNAQREAEWQEMMAQVDARVQMKMEAEVEARVKAQL